VCGSALQFPLKSVSHPISSELLVGSKIRPSDLVALPSSLSILRAFVLCDAWVGRKPGALMYCIDNVGLVDFSRKFSCPIILHIPTMSVGLLLLCLDEEFCLPQLEFSRFLNPSPFNIRSIKYDWLILTL